MIADTEVTVTKRGSTTLVAAALVVAWIAAAGVLAAMLVLGATGPARFPVLRGVLHGVYALALVAYLGFRGRSIAELPTLPLGRRAATRLGRSTTITAAIALCLVGLFDTGLFMLLLAAAGVGFVVVWRREVALRASVAGTCASALAFLAGGVTFWRHGFVAKPMLALMLLALPPMFVAGSILVVRTGLGGMLAAQGRYGAAIRGFLRGTLLFVPLGLANAAGRASFGPAWVDAWWQPFVLPMWSGIVEEVVFRAVLVCLLVALLRPALRRAPAAAIGGSILASAVIFGLAHGQTVGSVVGAGLGFGLPMAVVFVRRDWEHAVGAHYMVNFVPWLMALLAA